jgi:carboxyl-terminal processing protease
MKKQSFSYIAVFVVVLAGALGFCASCVTSSPNPVEADLSSQDEIDITMEQLELLYRTIDDRFLFDIDHDEIYDSMAKALFSALDDPYSSYTTEEESQKITDTTLGVYGGIGAYISKPNPDSVDMQDPETYMITIVSPFVGSPAYRAGLHAGDLISHVDGEEVIELTVEEASGLLRGEPGTVVVLTIHRGSSSFDVRITREIVEIPTVRSDKLGPYGYIHILEFTPYTPEKVQEAIAAFAETGFKALIIDLRSNPGGSVDAGRQIADMFLSDRVVLTMETRKPEETQVLGTRKNTLIPQEIPIVLLIDNGSASTSEILAGALKDNERATLIGSTSFGKGLVQGVFPFGKDIFKISIARYLTPSGADIHKIGIEPDITVEIPELTEEQIENYIALTEQKTFSDFVANNPVEDDEQITEFIQSLIDEGSSLSERYLRRFIRMEYEYLMDVPPAYDLDFDIQLNRAVEYLNTGE